MEDLRGAFLVYDVDRNGAISAEELHQVSRSLGERKIMAECVEMIKGVDSDGDGLAGQFWGVQDDDDQILTYRRDSDQSR